MPPDCFLVESFVAQLLVGHLNLLLGPMKQKLHLGTHGCMLVKHFAELNTAHRAHLIIGSDHHVCQDEHWLCMD